MVAREIKYLKTLEALKGEILSGKYSRRRIFPSVTAVTRRFGISRLTAVKVFDKLKELGLVHAHPGSGTFVSRNALARTIGLVMPGVACAATLRGCKWSDDDSVLVADPDDVKAVRRHLRAHPETDAFVCENDTAAVTLCQTLAKLHLKVPDDVMLAGFDDIRIASFMAPPLTTIHQPCEAIAEAAFYRLLQRIRNPMLPPQDIYLPATLVVRESTAGHALCKNPKPKKGKSK